MLVDSNAMKIIAFDILSVNVLLGIMLHMQLQPNLNFFIKTKYFNFTINCKDFVAITTFGYSFYILRKYS